VLHNHSETAARAAAERKEGEEGPDASSGRIDATTRAATLGAESDHSTLSSGKN
jgi:hypothetical protein